MVCIFAALLQKYMLICKTTANLQDVWYSISMYSRKIDLNYYKGHSFFLWGPRKSGKSTLLKSFYTAPENLHLDLLTSDVYRRYLANPSSLRQELTAAPHIRRVILDEIQKVPELLDEVHWLIENAGMQFCLCGSSARKLKRGQANLLGGRALKAEMFGLVSPELGDAYDLIRLLNTGYLPQHFSDAAMTHELLRAYVGDYLKEEVAAEGLVRNLPAFSDFLHAVSFSDGGVVNISNIARDCGVANNTVKGYLQILVDTLLARWVPAYTKQPKRRVQKSPKFYFFDVGVVNFLSKRRNLAPGSKAFGHAFENHIAHELAAHASYSHQYYDITYWQLSSGIEVDFILGDMQVAVEVKSASKVGDRHLKSLRELSRDYTPKRRILLCLDNVKRMTEDGIEIYPYQDFLEELWSDQIIV